MRLLLFAGAGTSAELGVPAMRRMAEQFIDHLHDIDLERSIVDKVERLIVDAGNDMEHAIDVIDKVEAGLLAQRKFGMTIDEAEIVPYRTLREEAEWFVQHSCEQIRVASALRMWSPTLRAAKGVTLTIASTNYDRAIEISASRLKIVVDDGFNAFAGREIAAWNGFSAQTGVRLLKLHGSTDWYHGTSHEVFKLRHPMPLYGPLELISKRAANLPLHSALVLPSREKTVTLPPFPALNAEFRNRAEEAEIVIFVGSSLRDPHIRDVCVSCAKQKPTFVVSRNGAFAEGVLPVGASVIRQSSGQFLIASFPQFLQNQDIEVLKECATSAEPAMPNVLEWIVTGCAENALTRDRCAAIENLANARIPLPRAEIELLLKSADVQVKLYSLGLVQASPDKNAILALGRNIAAQDANAEFIAELTMLEQIVASTST